MSGTGTGEESTKRVGADDGDGCDVAERVVPCSAVSAPPSRRPSSSAMVGGGTARSSLNLEPFLGGGAASPDGVADVGGGAVRWA